MTNEELKKKIMEVIDNSVDDWATRDKRGRIHVHIERIADALIAAGYRKQSDVAREFAGKLLEKIQPFCFSLIGREIKMEIMETVGEFGAEVEE